MRLVPRSHLGAPVVRRLVAATAAARSVPVTAMHMAAQEDHGYTLEVTR